MPYETEKTALIGLADLAKIQDARLCPHRSPAGCSRNCAQRIPGRVFRAADDLWDVDPPGCAVLVGAYASMRVLRALEAFPDLLERMAAPKPKRKKKSPQAPLCQRGDAGGGNGPPEDTI